MRLRGSYRTAAIILGICVAWVASGAITKSDENDAKKGQVTKQAPESTQVSYVDSVAQITTAQVSLTGTSLAHRSVELRNEVSGRVAEIVIDRGTPVNAGDVLIRLAPDDRPAKLRKARSLLAQRDLEYKAARRLSSKAFASKVKLATAKADRDSAAAAVKAAALDLANTEIKAPFTGTFDTRTVNVGDYLSVGTTIGSVIDLDPLEVEVEVTEERISQVQTGTEVPLTMPDGNVQTGIVSYIAAAANPSTRTFTVRIEMSNPDNTYGDGMTVQVALPLGQVKAHRISPAYLTLSPSGNIGIHAVDKNNTVVFYPANMVREDSKGLWVTGLPDKIRLITVGQDYVVAGDKVDPKPDTLLNKPKTPA